MASTISAGLTTTTSLIYKGDTSGVLQLQTNGTTTAVTIDTSQNVGIGTASPSYKLDVNGTANLRSTDTAVYIRWDNSKLLTMQTSESGSNATEGVKFTVNGRTQYGVINAYGGALRLVAADSGANGATIFSKYDGTTSTESMRIDTSGNLLVGTTSTLNGSIFTAVQSGSNVNTGYFRSTNASNPLGVTIEYSATAPNNTSNLFLNCGDNSTGRFQVRSNGGLANYSGNNVNLSDETLKKDITPAKSYLNVLNQIPVVTYLFNDQTDNELNLGVTAQSVKNVAPELVGTMDIGTKEVPNVKLAIYETDLKYAMLKAIQELSAKVTALEAKVA